MLRPTPRSPGPRRLHEPCSLVRAPHSSPPNSNTHSPAGLSFHKCVRSARHAPALAEGPGTQAQEIRGRGRKERKT